MRRVLELCNGELWILLDARSFNKPPALDTERAGPDDSAATPSELAQGISDNKALDYFWVDLHIGTLMRYGDESTGNWSAHEIWTRRSS
jgi:hypothetical protein